MGNQGSDSGCLDELRFYGNPTNGSSVIQLPYASCNFFPIEFDSDEVRHKYSKPETWVPIADKDAVAECHVEHSGDLDYLTVGICENGELEQHIKYAIVRIFEGAQNVKLDLKLSSDSGHCQTSIGKRDYIAGSSHYISRKRLGSCDGFKLEGKIKVTFGYQSSDTVCIHKVVFHEVSSSVSKLIRHSKPFIKEKLLKKWGKCKVFGCFYSSCSGDGAMGAF